jgi:hypothetical protein
MQIRLICCIEDNRWIVRFLDGPHEGRQGDFRLFGFGREELKVGKFLSVNWDHRNIEPTVANYCGRLTMR